MKKIVFLLIFLTLSVYGVMACEEANYDFTSTILHIPVAVVDSKIYFKVDLKLNGDSFSLSGATQAQSLVNGCQSTFDSSTLVLNVPFISLSGKYYGLSMKSAANYGFPLKNVTITGLSPSRTITIGKENGRTLRKLTGVNCGPDSAGDTGNPMINTHGSPALNNQYKQIGVTMVRTHDFQGPFDMYEMYHDHTKNPDDVSSFNFKNTDAQYKFITDNGHELYLRIGDSSKNPTPPQPENLDNYVTAMVNVIRHYKSGKWNGFTSNFRYVEIWNEPDARFWPGYSTDYFIQFYVKAAKAIKTAFPDLKVGGSGFTSAGSFTDDGKKFTEQFVSAAVSGNAPLDFISWHAYTNVPDQYTASANYYRALLDKYGFAQSESHVTEWNTEIGTDSAENTELRFNAKGAAINTANWIALQQTDVSISTFYRGNDSSMDLSQFYGLFKADGTYKKVALAFSLWSNMVNFNKVLSVTGGDAGFRVLAGKSTDGKIALLIANMTSAATAYALSFDGTSGLSASNYSVTIEEVSDASGSVQARTGNPGFISLGGYAVELVTITPLK
ncbi:MAG: hypothetical protein HQK89_17470 [Nitrospirae bacterium]|nr:hypothetical protein [Nitrospirota bacterium]